MSLNAFLRSQITKLEKSMLELAEKTVAAPLGQVDYLIVVGKYRGFKSLRDSYVDMLKKDIEPEDLEDDLDEPELDARPRRAAPASPVRTPPRPHRARSWGGR
jgi:hypothetical protein